MKARRFKNTAIAAFLLVFLSCADQSNPTGNTFVSDPHDSLFIYRAQAAAKINQYRSSLGLSPLALDTSKSVCSDSEAKSDAQTNTPHGAFGNCGEGAQNECPGWNSLESIAGGSGCIDMMWNEGPGTDYSSHGHYINMTGTAYTKVSVGFCVTASNRVWSVQNFYR